MPFTNPEIAAGAVETVVPALETATVIETTQNSLSALSANIQTGINLPTGAEVAAGAAEALPVAAGVAGVLLGYRVLLSGVLGGPPKFFKHVPGLSAIA